MLIQQTSCSELLVDTDIHDPEVAHRKFSTMFKLLGWEPIPTLEQLRAMKEDDQYCNSNDGNEDRGYMLIEVSDRCGNSVSLQYGFDSVEGTTGYRFEGNDYDESGFPIFMAAIELLGGTIRKLGGGHVGTYYEWEREQVSKGGKSDICGSMEN